MEAQDWIHQRVGGVGGRGPCPPPHFFAGKKTKKETKGKKGKVSKQKLLNGCHQSQNVTVLAILECLEFKNFPCCPTMVAKNMGQCFMAPPL